MRRSDGGYAVEARAPWQGCTGSLRGTPAVLFAVATVYTVTYDGFANTVEYEYLLAAVGSAGVGFAAAPAATYVAGFLAFVAAFVGVATLTEPGDLRGTASAFAPTILPIAAAYEVAHNYPYVIRNAAGAVAVVTGVDGAGAPLAWLSLPAFWGSQVALVVLGHLIAVVAAHRVALDRRPTLRAARRAHLPLVVLMVGYTVLSLWIVSRPVVTG